MGREVRRVALDFQWPLNRVWEGFLNPYSKLLHKCPACEDEHGDSLGYSDEARVLQKLWYYSLYKAYVRHLVLDHLHPQLRLWVVQTQVSGVALQHNLDQQDVDALVEGNRLWDFTRTPLSPDQETQPNGWTKEPNGYHPTADEVNAWSHHGFGHDCISQSIVIKSRCQRLGVSHLCSLCGGTGNVPDPETEAQIDAWRRVDPPSGEGWQLWETVSEGSPVSPVFSSPEELASYLERHGSGLYANMTYDTWLQFIQGPGWAPSSISVGGGPLVNGVQAIVDAAQEA